jgi:rod shape determining protein RodA
LFLVTLALGGVGILAASVAQSDTGPLYQQHYAVNQALGLVAGVGGAVLFMAFDYRWLGRHLRLLFGLAIVVLLAVLTAGVEINGSQSWIGVGPVQLQPSEFAKLLMIIVLAGHISNSSFASNTAFLKILGILGVVVLLVLAQPDLGTAMVFVAIYVAMIFVGGARWYQLGALFVTGVVAFLLAIELKTLEDYQLARLTSFLNPESAPAVSYQVENSKMAIGSGGLMGQGLHSSATLTDLGYLPEVQTDFIFAILAEKAGFVGSLTVLLLLFLLIWRVLRAATISRDRFGVLIATGVAAMLTFHALINVGMAMGMMPVTGLPLPFISYGRSNLVMNLLSVGIIQSVVIQSRLESQKFLRA